MPPNIVELEPVPTNYRVAQGSVLLNVTVGEQQKGTVTVRLDDNEIAEGGSMKNLDLGAGGELSGKTLSVTTTVTATNPANILRTVVTYRLTGGANDLNRTTDRDATGAGKTVRHVAEFLFE